MNRKITLLDGAMGTNLVAAGMPSGVCVEKWISEHKDIVLSLQRKYIEAGSGIIYAPTFGANPTVLSKYGISDCVSINAELLSISKEAAKGSDVLIAGDISSTGLLPRPYGDACYDDMYSSFKAQAEALENAGADLFVIETSSSLFEVCAALDAVRDTTDKKVFTTFTVGKTGKTLVGDDIGCCLVTLQERGADAFGLNCSEGMESVYNALERVMPFAKIPIIAKPNAGVPVITDGIQHFSADPREFAEWGKKFAELGVSYLGGCCGTDPSYIEELKKMLDGNEFDCLPAPSNKVYACSGSELFEIKEELELPERIVCDEELLFNAPSAGDADYCRILIEDKEQCVNLAEACSAIELPLMLSGSFENIVEGIKNYVGRCVIDPDCDLDESEKNILKTKYGCVII